MTDKNANTEICKELKACPFCKCTEIVAGKDYTRGNYRVDCLGCSAFITAPSLELAIQYWNTRPIEDVLRAELEKHTVELHYANTACMEMKHELDRLTAELAALREQVRWRKYPEEKPDEMMGAIVLREDGSIRFDFICTIKHDWFSSSGEVTHWMPLPPPPEEQE